MRIAINGFGRIGRTFLRTILEGQKISPTPIEVVAINLGGLARESAAHMFVYDTTMGAYGPEKVEVRGSRLFIGELSIELLSEVDAKKLPWKSLGIDWVVDCSGHYTDGDRAKEHVTAGARKVLISAPAKGPDCTIIPGVNDDAYDAQKHTIVSLGSCTSNAVIPLLHLLENVFGIEVASAVTTHAYTNTQPLLDGGITGSDWRKHRAGAMNIIPTTTGAHEVVEVVLPNLSGKISLRSLRVPVSDVSFLEVNALVKKPCPLNECADQIRAWVNEHPVMTVTDEPLVSSDFIGNDHSIILDMPLLTVTKNLMTVFGWYDNEWGYCCRMRDFLAHA